MGRIGRGTEGLTAEESARLAKLRELELLDTSPEEVFDRFTWLVQRLLHVPVALISLVDHDRQFFKSHRGLPEPWASQRETPLSHSFCKLVVGDHREMVVTNSHDDPRVQGNRAIDELGVVAYAGVPIDVDGVTVGALCAIDSQVREWSVADLEILRELAVLLETELALRRANNSLRVMQAQLQRQAVHDELTGLLNRRGFRDQAERALQLAHRHGQRLALFYIDVDGLKQINDTRGHAAGDHALRDVADAVRASFRTSDLLARLGGDEFVALAIEYEHPDATPTIERVRTALAAVGLGASIGAVICEPTITPLSLDHLLATADERMYEHKARSRPDA